MFVRSCLNYFSIAGVGKLPHELQQTRGKSRQSHGLSELVDPNEPRGAFGAAKELQIIFWKYWLSLCSTALATCQAQLSSTDTAQGLYWPLRVWGWVSEHQSLRGSWRNLSRIQSQILNTTKFLLLLVSPTDKHDSEVSPRVELEQKIDDNDVK